LHNKQIVQNTDKRIDGIVKDSNYKEVKLRENYAANIDALKQTSEEDKNEIRLALLQDKVETVQNLKEMVQKQELEKQNKMSETRSNYEKRIAEMNDQFMREKRMRDNREKKLVTDLKRDHDMQLETVKIKYEERNKQTELAHQKELKEITRHSQEQIAELTNTLKKT